MNNLIEIRMFVLELLHPHFSPLQLNRAFIGILFVAAYYFHLLAVVIFIISNYR